MLTTAAPTILSVETDSAWVVIIAVSVVTLLAVTVLRRLIGRPGGLASGILLALPLVLPVLAAIAFRHSAMPEIAVLRPAGEALRQGSGELMHLLLLSDAHTGMVRTYALSGTAGSWVLIVGLSITSFMLVRRLVGTILLHRLIRRSRPPSTYERRVVGPIVARLAADFGLRDVPRVLLLPHGIAGAVAVGARRGRILVSGSLLEVLDPAELEAILAHEVAHLEARDCQVMFLAGLLRDLVAWNPIAHLSFRMLLTDREFEADRRAAAVTGKPLAVASSLLKVCELVKRGGLGQRTAMAFIRPGARVARRVANLLALADGRATPSSQSALPFALAGALVAILGLQVGARIASQDARGFAITWGTPAATTQDVADLRGIYRSFLDPRADRKAARGVDELRPQIYAALANSGPVRHRYVEGWYRAMDAWTEHQTRPLVRLRWESRTDWRGVPLLTETVGPFGLYTLERQPL